MSTTPVALSASPPSSASQPEAARSRAPQAASWCRSSCCSASSPDETKREDSCLCTIFSWICAPIRFVLSRIVSCLSCLFSCCQKRSAHSLPKGEGEYIEVDAFLDTWERTRPGDPKNDLLLWKNQLGRLRPAIQEAMIEEYSRHPWSTNLPPKNGNPAAWCKAVWEDLEKHPYEERALSVARAIVMRAQVAREIKPQIQLVKNFLAKWKTGGQASATVLQDWKREIAQVPSAIFTHALPPATGNAIQTTPGHPAMIRSAEAWLEASKKYLDNV